MSVHPITQATEIRNVSQQLALFVSEPRHKAIAVDLAERARQLIDDLRAVLDEPTPRIPTNKSEWD
jgi:hypothetical protein